MKSVGTRSLLYGSHQFVLHPLMVAWAWWRLYGFPADPRLWVAFFVHDLGYVGKPNMDGPEGDTHPEWGAQFMTRWFGSEWGDLCRYHSRFIAKRDKRNPSRLCAPDKLAAGSWPAWLYVFLCARTGELTEYMERTTPGVPSKYESTKACPWSANPVKWYGHVSRYLREWAWTHRDGRYDTWTQPEAVASGQTRLI